MPRLPFPPSQTPDFRILFESSPALFLVMTPDLKIVAASDAYLKATMTERANIMGRDAFEVFPDNPSEPPGENKAKSSLLRVLKNKTSDTIPILKYDIRRPESEGGEFEVRYWSIVNSPVFEKETQEIDFIIHRVEDVTEFVRREFAGEKQNQEMKAELFLRTQELQEANHKLLEAEQILERRVKERTRELQHAQQQLVQQERLRALGEMAGGISHDFNNALSPILGYIELILDNPAILQDKETCLDYLRTMSTSAKDASGVVRRLREFARLREETESFAAVSLNELVKEVLVMTQPKWKNQALTRGICIELHTNLADVPEIFGSETEIRELLTNLIFNAIDALPKGGGISISTRADSGRVELRMADTGTGMSEEVRRRCLEPFFTTKGDRGTGLGLSMVYGILQRHEGTIDIQSQLGEGTVFTLTFPESGKDRQKASEDRPAAVFSRRLRVLYIEDEKPVREVFRRYLEHDGHLVDAVGSGQEALAKFDPDKYDLVITDHAMPGMSGEEFALQLKRRAPAMPVILLSGTIGLKASPGKSRKNIDAVLKKPATLEELRRILTLLFS